MNNHYIFQFFTDLAEELLNNFSPNTQDHLDHLCKKELSL